ncbi:MAG: hypothetical protein A3F67_10525 [Verrucomicrobia bacterium RIFCSPHIGHO2_12_FULL_41_10]|nr:MAG: hypothetical protein A3F67_10525 [Verrucomicrobia bacterium RIFCSPHIGHO2_12_FULL_41_10]HLB33345.1 cytochrome c biogenesis protein CcsA [Chthoniobacterales bacterium]
MKNRIQTSFPLEQTPLPFHRKRSLLIGKYSVNPPVEYAKESTDNQSSSDCARSSKLRLPFSISHLPSPTATAVSTAYSLQPTASIRPVGRIVTLILIACFSFLLPLSNSLAEGEFSKNSIPSTLETLPIQEGGRRKPYLVFSEETLRALSGKTSLLLDGKKISAPALITSFWLKPQLAYSSEPLILISYKPLKEALGLDSQQKLFSYDLLNHNEKLLKLIAEASTERRRDPRKNLQGLLKEASNVGMRLALFEELHHGSIFRIVPNPEGVSAKWATLPEWEQAERSENRVLSKFAYADEVQGVDGPQKLSVQELLDASSTGATQQFAAEVEFRKNSNSLAAQQALTLMQEGWSNNNPSTLAQGVEQLRIALQSIEAPNPVPPWKLQLEVIYQKTHPFRWAWIFYAGAGLLLFLFQGVSKREKETRVHTSISPLPSPAAPAASPTSHLPPPTTIRPVGLIVRVAWFLAGSGFFLQSVGLLARILIAGRPPVTNMYESIIWVAFGTILFALIFESVYHAGIFLLGAIPVAVASLILADSQPMILDPSIHPLTPVLRDNFWLTIHVLTITLSYAAFALSLGIAHVVLIRIILNKKVSAALYNYLYRVLQIGVFLLATGVILGGVWANYSWGRFWDWDPKETWALIALLGYLFLLHGRIAGRWSGFGLAIGSILAFLSVLMAWYGVNFVLGAGLHSYGFGTGGFPIVLGFVGLELALVTVAAISYRTKRK